MSIYLTTRVVELCVHTDDLTVSVVSVGRADGEPPRLVADLVISLLVELARSRSGDLRVIRALVRRERAGSDVLRVL